MAPARGRLPMRWPDVRVTLCLLGLCLVGCSQPRGTPSPGPSAWRPAQSTFDTPEQWERVAALFSETYRYDPAIRSLEQACELRARSLGRAHPDTVATRVALARLHARLGRELSIAGEYGRAGDLFVSAQKLCGDDAGCAAQVTHDLGVLHLVRGDLPGAESAFRASHTSMPGTGEEHLAELVWVRAAWGRQGDAEEILRVARAAHQHATVAGQAAHEDDALEAIATSLEATRAAYAGPLAPLQRNAMTRHARGPGSVELADALHALSDAHAARGAFHQAHALLAHALILRRKSLGEMHPTIARTLNALSLLLVARGDIESALTIRDYTRSIMHTALETMLASASEEEILRHLTELRADTDALVSLHLGMVPDRSMAAHLVFDSILRDKSRALDVIAARTALLRMHSRERIRSYFGDWQPGLFTWETQRRQRQERAIAALEELGRLRAALADSTVRGGDPSATARLERDIETLERQVIELAGTRRIAYYTSTAMVQRQLPDRGALIELVQYRPFDFRTWTSGAPRYAAYVLRADGQPSGVDLGPASEIDARVHELRQAIAARRPMERVMALARLVDDRLMARIRPLLGDARAVFVSPDGTLHLLPFAALVDEQGRYLVERFAFTYLDSGRDLVVQRRPASRARGAVIIAAPDFDAAPLASEDSPFGGHERMRSLDVDFFAPLPGTAQEAAALRGLLPEARIWTGDQATEALLARLQRPQILHVATHGIFLGETDASSGAASWGDGPAALGAGERRGRPRDVLLRTGLALAGANRGLHGGHPPGHGDGLITGLEIASLDLLGTELVVLSACDTGLGVSMGDRGVSGLRRALAVAGAETQVLSLWQISDAGTIDLMKAYYQRVLAGAGRSAAMHETQRELLQRPASSHPFYWASFIVSGQPGPLAGLQRGTSEQASSSSARAGAGERPAKVLLWALPGEPGKEAARGHIVQSIARAVSGDPRFTSIDPATITLARLTLGLTDTTLTINQACRFGEMAGIDRLVLIDGYDLGARSAEKRRIDVSGRWADKQSSFTESSVWLSVKLLGVDVATCATSGEIPISGHGRYVGGSESAPQGALLRAQDRFERHLRARFRELAQQ
jgi:CHAT domain-containing protein